MNNNTIHIVTPEPNADLVKAVQEQLLLADIAQFADEVNIARTIWKKYPHLVTAKRFPRSLKTAMLKAGTWEDSHNNISDKFMDPRHRESLLPHATEIAKIMGRKRREAANDDAFLKGMGIES